jgi:hypothetical protein
LATCVLGAVRCGAWEEQPRRKAAQIAAGTTVLIDRNVLRLTTMFEP